MASTLRYLHHPASQPCRAVQQFMLETDIPFEEEIVDIMAGINEKEDFKKQYNPTGQVPILVDGDFLLYESAAIAYYLNEKFKVAPNWFGGTLEERAIIQQFLHWHSTTLRRGAGAFFYSNFAISIWGDRDYSKEIQKGRCVLEESMGLLEGWLSDSKFLCGDEISFADLQSFHEFVSHHAGGVLPDEEWAKFPSVKRWFDELWARPHCQSVSTTILEVGRIRKAGEVIPMTRRTSLAKGTEVVGSGNVGIPYFNE
ncbi:MAG: glutathione S-transferase family protein [Gammaproteobacteria bacterium]